jgi:hypothetical protein
MAHRALKDITYILGIALRTSSLHLLPHVSGSSVNWKRVRAKDKSGSSPIPSTPAEHFQINGLAGT